MASRQHQTDRHTAPPTPTPHRAYTNSNKNESPRHTKPRCQTGGHATSVRKSCDALRKSEYVPKNTCTKSKSYSGSSSSSNRRGHVAPTCIHINRERVRVTEREREVSGRKGEGERKKREENKTRRSSYERQRTEENRGDQGYKGISQSMQRENIQINGKDRRTQTRQTR